MTWKTMHNLIGRRYLVWFALLCGCLNLHSQTLTWITSKAEAFQLAAEQGKRVLLVGGRDNCYECEELRHTICELTNPNIVQLIQSNFVPWYCNIDFSSDWTTYAKGLGGFSLPLVACIDPQSPATYLGRRTGLQVPVPFYNWLQNYAPVARPKIDAVKFNHTQAVLSISGLTAGTTVTIEKTSDPFSGQWTTVATLSSQSESTDWVDSSLQGERGYYRIKASR